MGRRERDTWKVSSKETLFTCCPLNSLSLSLSLSLQITYPQFSLQRSMIFFSFFFVKAKWWQERTWLKIDVIFLVAQRGWRKIFSYWPFLSLNSLLCFLFATTLFCFPVAKLSVDNETFHLTSTSWTFVSLHNELFLFFISKTLRFDIQVTI